jgi:tetratricopeptide (TPR) repeat protein
MFVAIVSASVSVGVEVVEGEVEADVDSGQRLPLVHVALASLIDLLGAALVLAGRFQPRALLFALLLHLAATVSLGFARRLPNSQRVLLMAFGLTLPVVGAPIALLSLAGGNREHSELGDAIKEEPEAEPAPELALIREVADGLPAPDALLVASVEERRARLWALGRRGDAESIALLRWALTAGPNQLGLEAALALEDMSIEFEKKLKAFRSRLELEATAADARAAGDLITHACEVAAIDGAQLRVYADEARRHYDRAVELDPTSAAQVAVGRARLELAILRPDLALAAIDQALTSAPASVRVELHKLRDEAEIRAHDLPWESPSLLSTWRSFRPQRSLSRRGSGHRRLVLPSDGNRRRR